MQIWALISKDLKRLRSDRRALLVNLLLPLLLTLIMGVSFGGAGSQGGVSGIPIIIVANGVPDLFRDRLTEGLQQGGFFSVTWADSQRADARVRSGDATAALVLPDGLLDDVLAGRETTVELWKDPGSPLKSNIVEQILDRMITHYQAGDAAYRTLWPDDVAPAAWDEDGESLADLLAGDMGDIWRRFRKPNRDRDLTAAADRLLTIMDHQVAFSGAMASSRVVLRVTGPVDMPGQQTGEDTNLFNYFLPSFAVFFLMFAVAASARDIHRERAHLTLRRQLVSPLSGWQFVLGKWSTAVVQGVLQLAVLFGVGMVLFRVSLGPDMWSLAVVMIATSAAAAGLFVLLALLTPNEKVMDNLSTVVVLVSAMIGGNFLPVDAMPLWLRNWGQLVFNYWANLGFNEVVVNNHSLAQTPRPVLVLTAFSLVMLAANYIVFSLRMRRGGLA